ncbi:MAG: hypothetical protein IJ274_14055, partial [Lachnospiraceae bacterium]|nr:hypothetical protein [Lachnospiraceae bacterium]
MYKRFFVIIIFLLLLVVNGGMGVAAVNTGFSTEPLSPDDTDTFLKNANISVLEEAPEKKAIKCFDVNEEGVLAV